MTKPIEIDLRCELPKEGGAPAADGGTALSSGCAGSSPVPGLAADALQSTGAEVIAHQRNRFAAALRAFQPDVMAVIDMMGDGEYCLVSASVAEATGVPQKRVQAIHRALRTFGFAECGPIIREDDGAPMGSGYWITVAGEKLRDGFDTLASVDTHPQGGDANAAPFMSGAVPAKQGDAQC